MAYSKFAASSYCCFYICSWALLRLYFSILSWALCWIHCYSWAFSCRLYFYLSSLIRSCSAASCIVCIYNYRFFLISSLLSCSLFSFLSLIWLMSYCRYRSEICCRYFYLYGSMVLSKVWFMRSSCRSLYSVIFFYLRSAICLSSSIRKWFLLWRISCYFFSCIFLFYDSIIFAD